MGQVRCGAAVAAVPGRVSAVLLICGAASIEFDEALRMAVEGAKGKYDGKLD